MASTLKNNESRSKALKYAFVVATVFVVLAASFFYSSKKENESAVYTKTLMGTVVQITLMEGDVQRFDEAAEAAARDIMFTASRSRTSWPLERASRICRAWPSRETSTLTSAVPVQPRSRASGG